jgi:hypothetical protein
MVIPGMMHANLTSVSASLNSCYSGAILLLHKEKMFSNYVYTQTGWPKGGGYEFGVSQWSLIC